MTLDLAIDAFNSFLAELKAIRMALEDINITLKEMNGPE